MPGLRFAILLVCTLAAGLFFFVGAGRYAMHIQSAINYAWPARPQHAVIIFGGDMMFDRTIRPVVDEKGGDFIFSCIDPVLRTADFVVANLEGPITEHASVSASSTPGDAFNYTFTFSPATAELLYSHRIRMVNLGNNHILNFGWEGARSTTRYLQDAGVAYFGLPAEVSEQEGGPVKEGIAEGTVRGVKLAFINYNEFSPAAHSNIPSTGADTDSIGLENIGMSSTTINQVQRERARGYMPVVYAHWGIEYATTSSAYSRELAHSFIDAGAEIVIGSHPHVVQEHEIYRGKYIYYSLGNFIFDQYFSEDVRHGLLLEVTFGPSGVQVVREIPIELQKDRRTCPVE